MTLIPQDQITQVDLEAWYSAKIELAKVQAKELLLRQRIFGHFFPNPVEGTNTFELPLAEGVPYALKGVYVINRSVDAALLETLTPVLREKNVPVDSLIERKPTLALGMYRKLTEEERKLFDQVLDIKTGTPQLKIEEIKRRK